MSETPDITCRDMMRGESKAVYALVERGFDAFVRADLTQEGVEEFLCAAREMVLHAPDGHVVLVAEVDSVPAGVIDVRDYSHICLFFVEPALHRRGVGRALLQCAIERCRAARPEAREINVHSSLYAEPVYRRLGFEALGPEQCEHGIRYVAMRMEMGEEA